MPCAGVRCLYDGTGRDGTDHAYPGLGGAVQYMTRTRLFGAAVARSIARMVWRSIADVVYGRDPWRRHRCMDARGGRPCLRVAAGCTGTG